MQEKVKNVVQKDCSVLQKLHLTVFVLRKRSVSSDGESANTGRVSGLWSRVEEYVGHPTLNIWCACHRSDLAMEDLLMQSVPELKVWNANVISVVNYYRASGLRTKEF